MKLRLLAASLAAVGMMAGVSARAATPVEYAYDDFSLYTNASTVVDMQAQLGAYDFDDDPQGLNGASSYGVGNWSTGANDLSKVVTDEDTGLNSLSLDTEGDVVTNALLSANADTLNDILAGQSTEPDVNGEIYLETTIAFVPSDEIEDTLQDGVDVDNGDLKFALYAYEHEVTELVEVEGNLVDQTTLVTNLVVYHSFVSGVDPDTQENIISYTNEVIASTSGVDFGQPQLVTVTMKALDGDVQNYFFKVALEGVDVEGDLGLDEPDLVVPTTGGPWFRTVNSPSRTTLSAINFSGTGAVSGLAVGYNTEAAPSTFAVDWTGSQNVVVSNSMEQIAGTSGDFEPNTVLTFYPTVGTITNVAGEAVANLPSFALTVTEATNIVVLAGEEPVPAPTIITVTQAIGGHGGSVSNGNFQAVAGVATPITITADQGYVVAQIVTNGAPVADALGETSVTVDVVFSDAAGADNSIVATFAPDSAWFLDPFVRMKTLSLGGSENTFCASLSPEEGFFFVGNSPGASSQGAEILDVQDFIASLNPAFAPTATATTANTTGALRGGAASAELQLGIAGTLTANANWVIPFDGSAPYTVTHSIGAALDAMDFGANSAYLYAAAYTSGFRTKVYKLSFANGLADGDTLTVEATYDVAAAGINRVRAICVETIGGTEYVYVTGGDGNFDAVAVIDTTDGTVTKLSDTLAASQPISIDVAGIADGNPRLYLSFSDKSQKIFSLAADGLSLVSEEPVATIPAALLGSPSCPNVFSLDGETNAVACATQSGAHAYVLEKKPANLIVRGTFDQGVTTDDRSVAFGAAANETFTAPAGETLISVSVNGVAQQVAEGATSFTYEAAELTEYVYIDMQSVEPQYTATYTGSENVIVTNTYDGSSYEWGEGEEVVPTQIACLSGTVLSFYPTEGNVITNVTIGGVVQTGFDPACYSITVISDTNLVVLAGETAQPAQKPAWAAEADDGDYATWAENHAAGQQLDAQGADYSAQYLLNVDANVTPTLHIDSVEVTDEGTKIVVSAAYGNTAINLAMINGYLDVYVGDVLGSLTKKAIPDHNIEIANNVATIIIPVADGKFVKAGVDYTEPLVSITDIGE